MYRREFMKFVGITISSGYIPLSLITLKEKSLKKKTAMPWQFGWYFDDRSRSCDYCKGEDGTCTKACNCKWEIKFECYSEISVVAFKKSILKFASRIEELYPLPEDAVWYISWGPRASIINGKRWRSKLVGIFYGFPYNKSKQIYTVFPLLPQKINLITLCSEIDHNQFSEILEYIEELRISKMKEEKRLYDYDSLG